MTNSVQFLEIAHQLEGAGLIWQPEIGDEITERPKLSSVSILVDSKGMTPRQLREQYLWLPTVEQMVNQLEARQALLFHIGIEVGDSSFCYKTVVQSAGRSIERMAFSVRQSMGLALRDLLLDKGLDQLH
jgi:hypothetical protein